MVLPLYLAMSAVEMRPIPRPAFLVLEDSQIPPAGVLPVITDAFPLDRQTLLRLCQGREAVLLDFERPPTEEVREMIRHLPCPAAAPPGYSDKGPVFLPPAPLHMPMEEYLSPWKGREIWLEAALQRQVVTVTEEGCAVFPPCTNTDFKGGFHSQKLQCRFLQNFSENRAVFTLFDTPDTLRIKLDRAGELGVTRAIGLFQELGEKHMSTY